jgi:hypothetical protein
VPLSEALKDYQEWKHLTTANRDLSDDDDDEELPQSWSDIKKLDNPEKELVPQRTSLLCFIVDPSLTIRGRLLSPPPPLLPSPSLQ